MLPSLKMRLFILTVKSNCLLILMKSKAVNSKIPDKLIKLPSPKLPSFGRSIPSATISGMVRPGKVNVGILPNATFRSSYEPKLIFRLRFGAEISMPGRPVKLTSPALALIAVHWRLVSALSVMARKAKFKSFILNPKSPTPAKALTWVPVKASISTFVVVLSESVTSLVDFSKEKLPFSLTKLKRLRSSVPDARNISPFMSSVTTVAPPPTVISPPIPSLTANP